MSWSNVRDVNEIGGVVTSRAVLADPPDLASMAEQMGYDTGTNEMVAVVVLIVVMALIEVVLLAGPAFAVGARRHARTLALIAASGGTPAQARRVILGSGRGARAGRLGHRARCSASSPGGPLLPWCSGSTASGSAPSSCRGLYLAAIVAFGLVSAVLAVRRARLARQPPGRGRGPRRPPRRPWAAGRDAGGRAWCCWAPALRRRRSAPLTSDNGNGAFWIAAAAIVSVLGMILVVPVRGRDDRPALAAGCR